MSGQGGAVLRERAVLAEPPHRDFPVSAEAYPWLPHDADVRTSLVHLEGGTDFYYGSIIGLNGTARKIAGAVPQSESEGLQDALFAALPDTLEGNPNPRVTKANVVNGLDRTLLIITKRSMYAAGLVFAVEAGLESDEQAPTVLRLGISQAKDYPKLMRLLGVKYGRG